MKLIKRTIILILLVISSNGFSQHWQSLDGGTCGGITIFGDTVNNILYMTGYMSCAGSVPVNNVAQWNGTSWDSLAGGSANSSLQGFHSAIYGGKMVCPCYAFGYDNCYIASWDGVKWDSVGTNFFTGSGFNGVAVLNSELYAFGSFDTINHISYNGLAKWNGSSWIPLGFPYRMGAYTIIRSLAMYNGNLYAGGVFRDSLLNIANISKFNGSYWSIPGGGFHGGVDDVFDLEVYQNELYAAGSFEKSDGNVGNGIARWNDTTWRDVGGGVTGSHGYVNDILLFNGKLYAGGAFQQMGGIPAQAIAAWDGTNWCGLGDSCNSSVSCLGTINHELFLTTNTVFDGITVNGIAQWIGGSYVDTCGHLTTGIDEIANDNTRLNIFPNPAIDQITLEFELNETKSVSIEIKNFLGQTVYSEMTGNIIGKQSKNIDVSAFSNGIYVVQLKDVNTISNKKFIKN